jgi:hypothetical protein
MTSILIDNGAALAEFRANRFTAGALATAIAENAVILINGPTGLGKSHLLDDLLDSFAAGGSFELVVVLAALTANLLERRLVRNPTHVVRRLRPRPSGDCGRLDPAWRAHEQNGTTAYAKRHICPACPLYGTCFWPGQYGSSLRGARIIFGTHKHLLVNPRLLLHLRSVTGADRVLLLLDEADIIASPFRVTLTPWTLTRFAAAVRRADLPEEVRRHWAEQATLLAGASTADLRSADWWFPLPSPEHALAVQEAGLADDPAFRWPGHDLHAFARSRPDRRWRDSRGTVVFVRTPYLAERTAIFSSGMPAGYVARQLGVAAVVEPFASVRCQHRGTHFYNLCSLLGAAARFRRNYPQILDLFVMLILRNVAAGRSTLLIARRQFKRLCAEYIERRSAHWGRPTTVVQSNGEPPPHASPTVLPLIHYGVNGVNSFESYDSALCLTSYLIDEDVLRAAVADVEAEEWRFPVSIRIVGRPRRRLAGTFDDRYRASDADAIAQTYYRQLETNVVIQAVGRVRFATRSREVITFQCSDMPGVELTREFANLREAREYFGLSTGSEFERRRQADEARRLRAEGVAVAAIAEHLGISERTVHYRLAASKRRGDE